MLEQNMKTFFAEQRTALINEVLDLIHKNSFEKLTVRNLKFVSTAGQALIGTTSASVTLSITGVCIIVVPITAGVGCATCILDKICSNYLKKKEQNYKPKYAIIQETLDDFRQSFTTTLKDNHIDQSEYHQFVNMYENYYSKINNTNKRDTTTPVAKLAATPTSHKPNSFLKLIYSVLT